jgi:enoyl-CoA hydratase/carnithine racemase
LSEDVTCAPTQSVLSERRGGVLVLTFNRPGRLNAWTDELESAYFDQLTAADADPQIKAIVVTGAGRGFCAGADMDELGAVDELDVEAAVRHRARPRTLPLTVRKPLVAAINGAAAGIGLVQALYCDVRFAVPDAKLTTAFARRGLVAEYGLSWMLPRMIGTGAASDLLLSGRVIRGEEAHRLGLVERLSEDAPVLEAAVSYATELAAYSSPWSMATIKGQIMADLDRDFRSAVHGADTLMIESLLGQDLKEGVQSYLDGRPPSFPPLR